MKNFLYISLIALFLMSCSDFQKAFRGDDVAAKFKMGEEMYNAEKWSKAHRLFSQVIQDYRGKPQAEKLTFMHAMCSYKMKDYYIASYHFKRFVDAYPKSDKKEQASFLDAKGYYHNSPIFSKEQKETTEAIEKLQLFINAYPNSKYSEEVNDLVKELDFKLEKKAFEIAKQYDRIRDYKASIKSFNNFLLDFPGSSLRKDALFYRFDAAYNLGTKSIKRLKEERLKTAISYFETLKKAYPNSEYLNDAERMNAELQEELNTITTP